jgi:hypothetical protein
MAKVDGIITEAGVSGVLMQDMKDGKRNKKL